MCNYKTMYKNEHGYVVRCNHCQHLHVAFGNTMLAFSQDQFYQFSKEVAGYYDMHQFVCCREEKRVQIPTAINSVVLVFSINELDHYRKLLQHACDALQRELLFHFSKN